MREDIVDALERAAEHSGMSVSRALESMLGFQLEMEGIMENARALRELRRTFGGTATGTQPDTNGDQKRSRKKKQELWPNQTIEFSNQY
jgi:hypothetical protein